MSTENQAFDTNVLVYFLDKDSPFHQQALSAFSFIQKSSKQIVVAQQNLIEFVQVLTTFYKISFKKSVSQVKRLLRADIRLVHPLPQTVSTYLSLCQKETNPRHHFDLYLAATLLDNNINTIVTADSSGFRHSTLKIIPLADFSML